MRAAGEVAVDAAVRPRWLRPISAVQLAAESEEVQTALKLTDDQKNKIEEINDELREDRRELFQGGGGGAMRKCRKLNARRPQPSWPKCWMTGSKKRLMGIQIQVNGAAVAVAMPAVAKELNITDDQKTKLEKSATAIRKPLAKRCASCAIRNFPARK